jgi:hypothetical protein
LKHEGSDDVSRNDLLQWVMSNADDIVAALDNPGPLARKLLDELRRDLNRERLNDTRPATEADKFGRWYAA